MPLPNPKKQESRTNFVSRCMSNNNIQNDFDTQDRRLAVCFSLWRQKKKHAHSKGFVVQAGNDEFISNYEIDIWDEPNPLDELEKDSNLKKSEISKEPDPKKDNAPKDDTKAEKSIFSPNHEGGLALNPDNSTAPVNNIDKPLINKMQWYMGRNMITNNDGDIEFLGPNNENVSDKVKQWYIACLEGLKAEWPLTHQKIEKDFDRPNKHSNPTKEMDKDKSKYLSNPDKIGKDEKQYII